MASAATSARDAWIASVVDDEGRRRQLRETAYCLEDFKQARLESLEHTLDLRSWPPLARMRFIDAWQRLKDGSAVDPVTAVVPAPAPETPFAGDEAPTPLPVEPAPPRAPSPLPAPAVVSPEGPPQPVASPTIATAWTCTACFSTNDDEDSACVVCQGPRPGVAAPSRDGNLEALMADYVYGFGNAPVAPAPAVAPPPLRGPASPRDPDRRSERRPERPNAPPPPPRPACTACLQIQNRGKAKKAHTCGTQRNRTPGYKWTEEQDLAILDVVRSGVGVMRRLDEGIVYAKTANAAFGFVEPGARAAAQTRARRRHARRLREAAAQGRARRRHAHRIFGSRRGGAADRVPAVRAVLARTRADDDDTLLPARIRRLLRAACVAAPDLHDAVATRGRRQRCVGHPVVGRGRASRRTTGHLVDWSRCALGKSVLLQHDDRRGIADLAAANLAPPTPPTWPRPSTPPFAKIHDD